jgi:hypothetical protein
MFNYIGVFLAYVFAFESPKIFELGIAKSDAKNLVSKLND